MNSMYQIMIIAICSVGFVTGMVYLINKFSNIKNVIVQISKILPELVDISEGLLTKGNPTEEQDKLFKILKQVAEDSASAVEQVAIKEDIHGEDKKKLALEYFKALTSTLNINVDDLGGKTAEVLIENAVNIMNKEQKNNILLE